MINSINSSQFISNTCNIQRNYLNTNVAQLNSASTYKADTFLSNNITPNDPIPVEPYKPKFFDRPEVRLGGMMLGAGAVGGGLGYVVGSAFGRAGLGAAIGAGVGIIAPVALIGYALWSWGRNH
ncbi:MAG: hypothetical protein KatS3mg068_2128 [Candidatus Sericytochromatia bacterium]|nr:MAG: hypothetical protein KatS3mg068_2128 [Candidatus Sericytochromatia bacterium]